MLSRIKEVEEMIAFQRKLIEMIMATPFHRVCHNCDSIIHAAMIDECKVCGHKYISKGV